MDDGANPLPEQTDTAAEDALRAVFPDGLPPAQPSRGNPFVRSFSLDANHIATLKNHVESGEALGVDYNLAPLTKVSRTHHRLAQLLAMGMDEGKAAVVCRYSANRVSVLKSDPMFQELLAFYSSQVDEEFVTVAEEMAALHEDTVIELRQRLEENPQQFTVAQLTELMKALSDRTGHGPTSTTNLNAVAVTLNGADLQRIKASDAASRGAERPLPVLSPEDRGTIEGVFTITARDVTPPNGAEGQPEGQGVRVRAEGEGLPEEGVAHDPVAVPSVGGVR